MSSCAVIPMSTGVNGSSQSLPIYASVRSNLIWVKPTNIVTEMRYLCLSRNLSCFSLFGGRRLASLHSGHGAERLLLGLLAPMHGESL